MRTAIPLLPFLCLHWHDTRRPWPLKTFRIVISEVQKGRHCFLRVRRRYGVLRIVTRLYAERRTPNRGLVHSSSKIFFYSPKCRQNVYSPPRCLFDGYWGHFPFQQLGSEADSSPLPSPHPPPPQKKKNYWSYIINSPLVIMELIKAILPCAYSNISKTVMLAGKNLRSCALTCWLKRLLETFSF
jgi:hypothetical protein